MRRITIVSTIFSVFALLLVILNVKYQKDIIELKRNNENIQLSYNELLTSYYQSVKYSNISLDSILLYDRNRIIVNLNEVVIDTTLILYIDYRMCQPCIEKEIINFKSLVKTNKYNYLFFLNYRGDIEDLELNISGINCFYVKDTKKNFFFESPVIFYTIKNQIKSLYISSKNNNDNFKAFCKVHTG